MQDTAAYAARGKGKYMGNESVLRARAREAMKAGKLPDCGPEQVLGGLGSGQPCAVCDKTVEMEDVELELQFASDRDSRPTHCHVHARCFTAWELERRRRSLNGQSLPPGDGGGIMLGRERNTTGRGKRG